jgi:uncharacterized protein (UPF0303 family)
MSLNQDIELIQRQERELQLPRFDNDTAWTLGNLLRDLSVSRSQNIVVDIRRFGQPHQQLFYTALSGTTPDNARWVQRKINVVSRFHKSSYQVGRYLEQIGKTFSDRYNLPEEDYAAHGGSFPLSITDAGILGAITVSGLPQRDDHNLVVEALCLYLKQDLGTYRLPELS